MGAGGYILVSPGVGRQGAAQFERMWYEHQSAGRGSRSYLSRVLEDLIAAQAMLELTVTRALQYYRQSLPWKEVDDSATIKVEISCANRVGVH